MCALFGWLDYKGIVSDKLLKKLTQALAKCSGIVIWRRYLLSIVFQRKI